MTTTFSSNTVESAPKVSVCMITYNHAPYIGQAIEGVLMQQTEFPFELIISEDCGPDQTRKVCLEYRDKYPGKIRLLLPESNLGMMDNFYTTLRAASGEYIAFCEGDDYWIDPKKLQKQADYLDTHPASGMVYTRVQHYKQKIKQLTCIWGEDRADLNNLLMENCIPSPTVMVRKELINQYLQEIRPNQYAWLMGDYPLWLWLSANSVNHFIPDVTAVYRVLTESAIHTRSYDKLIALHRSSMDIRLHFAAKYKPEYTPSITIACLWEQLKIAVIFRKYRDIGEICSKLDTMSAKADTSKRKRLRAKACLWLLVGKILGKR